MHRTVAYETVVYAYDCLSSKGLMMADAQIANILETHGRQIVDEWVAGLRSGPGSRRDLISDAEVDRQARELFTALLAALKAGGADIGGAGWGSVRELLGRISKSRALQGFGPSDTAMFVMSLKEPVFAAIRRTVQDAGDLADATWAASTLIDRLGLYTTEAFQKSREEVIARQQQEMMELSTPVVTLWEGILALPLIGTLDSSRTQVVMESLLQRIVDSAASIAILDITGVPTVDTLVAQHLLKTIAAARLMGADCIISGIRPQIAQTIVHLGVDLNTVTTKASLADAFAVALKRVGLSVTSTHVGRAAAAIDPFEPSARG
ncbi:MAG: STAS domain-containing protein [Vicinamibacterales bacterium]